MALAVASVTKAEKRSGSGSSPVTLVLPASLATGDMLIFSVLSNGSTSPNSYGSTGSRTFDPPESVTTPGDFPVPTGFTRVGGHAYTEGQGGGTASYGREAIFYKVVDGTETNYTFTQAGYYSFIRITGWNGANVNPLSDVVHNQAGGPYQTPTTQPFPLSRANVGLLLMQGLERYDTGTPSTPVITSTDTNPSWTEVYSFRNAGVNGESGFCYYATSTDTSDITAFTLTNAGRGFALYYIAEPTADTEPESTQLAVTAVVSPSLGTSANTAMSTQLAVTAVVAPSKGKGQQDTTQWRNQDKTNTNWNNLPK